MYLASATRSVYHLLPSSPNLFRDLWSELEILLSVGIFKDSSLRNLSTPLLKFRDYIKLSRMRAFWIRSFLSSTIYLVNFSSLINGGNDGRGRFEKKRGALDAARGYLYPRNTLNTSETGLSRLLRRRLGCSCLVAAARVPLHGGRWLASLSNRLPLDEGRDLDRRGTRSTNRNRIFYEREGDIIIRGIEESGWSSKHEARRKGKGVRDEKVGLNIAGIYRTHADSKRIYAPELAKSWRKFDHGTLFILWRVISIELWGGDSFSRSE